MAVTRKVCARCRKKDLRVFLCDKIGGPFCEKCLRDLCECPECPLVTISPGPVIRHDAFAGGRSKPGNTWNMGGLR